MPLEGPCTILGGLPVWAVCWYERGDGWSTDDDAGVHSVHWLKRDGSKGKEVTEKVYERLEKWDDYWESRVCDQVFEYLAHEQAMSERKESQDDDRFQFE